MSLKKSYSKYQFDTKDSAQSVDNPDSGFYVPFLQKDADGNHSYVIKYNDGGSQEEATFVFDTGKRITSIWVKNVSGTTLVAGTPIYANAYNSGADKYDVIAADANNASAMPAMGILDQDLSNNAEGVAILSGVVHDVDTSAWSVGTQLYVSATAGNLTATRPINASSQIQSVGYVMRSHAINGRILVFGAGRSNALPNLTRDKIWVGSSTEQPTETAIATVALTGEYSNLSGIPSEFTPSAHNHSASEITSGTFADARISESSVIQHVATNSSVGTQLIGSNTIGLEPDLRIGITKVGFTANYVEFDNTNNKIFFFAGGSKVGELDSSGNFKVTGDITAFATL